MSIFDPRIEQVKGRPFAYHCHRCGVGGMPQSERDMPYANLDGTPWRYYCSVTCAKAHWQELLNQGAAEADSRCPTCGAHGTSTECHNCSQGRFR